MNFSIRNILFFEKEDHFFLRLDLLNDISIVTPLEWVSPQQSKLKLQFCLICYVLEFLELDMNKEVHAFKVDCSGNGLYQQIPNKVFWSFFCVCWYPPQSVYCKHAKSRSSHSWPFSTFNYLFTKKREERLYRQPNSSKFIDWICGTRMQKRSLPGNRQI